MPVRFAEIGDLLLHDLQLSNLWLRLFHHLLQGLLLRLARRTSTPGVPCHVDYGRCCLSDYGRSHRSLGLALDRCSDYASQGVFTHFFCI